MLYRTHRPQQWADLIAQSHVSKTLTQEIITDTLAHAFLFCGPRGVGKTTSARLLAKSLNCKDRKKESAEPCNTCESCTTIAKGQSIDVIEIDAASHTGVDNVRENIIENARFTPTSGTYKIFIIDEVHMLSTSAFNALLKTIEEPPAHAIFVMATTEAHKIPATINSRCQTFTFKHISSTDIKNRLEGLIKKEELTIDDEVLDHIAWRAQGSMRDAESLLGQIIAIATDKKVTSAEAETVLPTRKNEQLISYLSASLSGDAHAALTSLNEIMETGANIPHIADDAIDIIRAILLLKATQSAGTSFFTQSDKEKLSEIANTTPTDRLLAALDILLKRRKEIGLSPIVHLPLEMASLEIALTSQNFQETTESLQHENTKTREQKIDPSATNKNNETTPPSAKENSKEDQQKKSEHTSTVIPAQAGIQAKNTEIPTTAPTQNIELPTIEQNWSKFLEHLHTYNHSLPLIMKTCKPISVESNTLTLSFPYEFHKKRVDEPPVREMIHKALHDTYNTAISIQTTVNEAQADEADKAVAEVLKTFGGKVIDA